MNITQKPEHTVSTPTRPNRATSKKQISISLVAGLLALLSIASPAMASGKAKPVRWPADDWQFCDSIKIRNHRRLCVSHCWRCWNESNHRCSSSFSL